MKVKISGVAMRKEGKKMLGLNILSWLCVLALGASSPQVQAQGTEDKGAEAVPAGKELVNMDFPELTDIKDIIKAVSLWTGKNVILDRNVNGKVQIISPQQVTKEEAYQAFLSSLNMLNLTTVETGKVIKILPIRTALKGNLKTFMGVQWTPLTDQVITQIVPLKYIDAKQIQTTLSRIVQTNSVIAYTPTNTLIVSDSGFKVKRILDIIKLLDVQTQQPKVAIVPIRHADAKEIATKTNEIFRKTSGGKNARSGYHSYKIMADERSNSVIIFGPPRTIKDVRALVKKFDIQLEDPSRQSTIHVRPLDYADAKKLAATLSSLASSGSRNNRRNTIRRAPTRTNAKRPANTRRTQAAAVADLGEGVKITADESSNALLITGSRSAYDAINSIIRKLDVRKPQVYIETDILDVSTDNNFGFGTSIFAGRPGPSGTNIATAWEAAGVGPLIVGEATNSGDGVSSSTAKDIAGAFSDNLTIGVLSGQSVNVPGLGNVSPGALIKLLKTDSNARVLSSPHILTSNNEDAKIVVGEKIFFNNNSTNPTTGAPIQKVEKEDVDLTLEIRPNISQSDYVTMKIALEANDAIQDVSGLPKVNKRQTSQIVTVKNGQTVVVSGLVRRAEYETYRKIPLLGDIPIIGWLFRNSEVKSIRSNLMIFFTPHIVHGAEDLAAIHRKKIAERDEFLESVYGGGVKDSDFYSSLPTLSDGDFRPSAIDEAEKRRLSEMRNEAYQQMGYSPVPEEEPVAEPTESEIPVPSLSSGDDDYDTSTPAGSDTIDDTPVSPEDDGGDVPPSDDANEGSEGAVIDE